MLTVRTLAFSLATARAGSAYAQAMPSSASKDPMKVMQGGMDMLADRMPTAPANK